MLDTASTKQQGYLVAYTRTAPRVALISLETKTAGSNRHFQPLITVLAINTEVAKPVSNTGHGAGVGPSLDATVQITKSAKWPAGAQLRDIHP